MCSVSLRSCEIWGQSGRSPGISSKSAIRQCYLTKRTSAWSVANVWKKKECAYNPHHTSSSLKHSGRSVTGQHGCFWNRLTNLYWWYTVTNGGQSYQIKAKILKFFHFVSIFCSSVYSRHKLIGHVIPILVERTVYSTCNTTFNFNVFFIHTTTPLFL